MNSRQKNTINSISSEKYNANRRPDNAVAKGQLQSHLLNLWTANAVDETYQNLFLIFIETLKNEKQQYKLIENQIKKTYQKNSLYFLLKQNLLLREQIKDQIESQIAYQSQGNNYKKPHKLQVILKQLCDKIKNLRRINLLVSETIIKIFQDFKLSRQCSIGSVGKQYIQNFIKIDTQNQFLKQSFLNQFILFQKGYDPFFLVHYEEIMKSQNPNTLKKYKPVQQLFDLNISYVYRLMRAQQKMLKYMLLIDDNGGNKQRNQIINKHKLLKSTSQQNPKKQLGLPSIKRHSMLADKDTISRASTIKQYGPLSFLKRPQFQRDILQQNDSQSPIYERRKVHSLNPVQASSYERRQPTNKKQPIFYTPKNISTRSHSIDINQKSYRALQNPTKKRKGVIYETQQQALLNGSKIKKYINNNSDVYPSSRGRQLQRSYQQKKWNAGKVKKLKNHLKPIRTQKSQTTQSDQIIEQNSQNDHSQDENQYSNQSSLGENPSMYLSLKKSLLRQQGQKQSSKGKRNYLSNDKLVQIMRRTPVQASRTKGSRSRKNQEDQNYQRNRKLINDRQKKKRSKNHDQYKKYPVKQKKSSSYERSPVQQKKYSSYDGSPVQQKKSSSSKLNNKDYRQKQSKKPSQNKRVQSKRKSQNKYRQSDNQQSQVQDQKNDSQYNSQEQEEDDQIQQQSQQSGTVSQQKQDQNQDDQSVQQPKRKNKNSSPDLKNKKKQPIVDKKSSKDPPKKEENKSKAKPNIEIKNNSSKKQSIHQDSQDNKNKLSSSNPPLKPNSVHKSNTKQPPIQKQNNKQKQTQQQQSQAQQSQTQKNSKKSNIVSTNSKIKMIPGKINFSELQNYVKNKKLIPFYENIMKQNTRFIINSALNTQTYLSEFTINEQLAAFALCSPTASGNMVIYLWAPIQKVVDQKTSLFLFKKFIDYLQKQTTFKSLVYRGQQIPQIKNQNFNVQKQKLYNRKRQIPITRQSFQFQYFLSIEVSNISFNQISKTSLLYSDEISPLSQTNSWCQSQILKAQIASFPEELKQDWIVNQQVKTIKQVNSILQRDSYDTFQIGDDKQMNFQGINMSRAMIHTVPKHGFISNQGYMIVVGKSLLLPQTPKQQLNKMQMLKDIVLYFGRGFKSVQQMIDILHEHKNKLKQQDCKFAFKMFSKQLYGKYMINQNDLEKGRSYYCNWDLNFAWRDEIPGKLVHDLSTIKHLYGQQIFFIALQIKGSLALGVQVSKQDHLY